MNGIKYILAVHYVYFEDVKRLERIQDDYFDVIKSFYLLLFLFGRIEFEILRTLRFHKIITV